ncbi:uncharacterized protein UV8b_03997 [Ustilaginoidea virens]|uniref:Uncharacterized protein n=1 Tax=Ustilaginoidea virens TaxID=1159556 RepID=A0A8E5MHB1_USTVR|nr:uncharacterized protein UV8b_03997 [Ustilaginoidea virens]QUC19756.1 hypothetical protein UV8b_03997 [Ustilaginoidea virens]
MGFLDPFTNAGASRPSKHRRDASRSRKKPSPRSRSSSRTRGASSAAEGLGGGPTGDSHYGKRNSSTGSFFGVGNLSRSSFFNFGNRSSYYKRSPRRGFMRRSYKRLRRLVRDLVHYAKRHPWKVLLLVVVPLLTTGVLGGLLARFGLRIPPVLERLAGLASRAAAGDSLGLVGDAVRMAGDMGGSERRAGHAARASSVGAGTPHGEVRWERRTSYGSYGGDLYSGQRGGRGYRGDGRHRGDYPGGGDWWGDAVADFAKRWF